MSFQWVFKIEDDNGDLKYGKEYFDKDGYRWWNRDYCGIRSVKFGTKRNNLRVHAACDLKVPEGTKVYPLAKGKVIRGPYRFYSWKEEGKEKWCYAIEILHDIEEFGGFIARYCEIGKQQGIRNGVEVDLTTVIGEVVKLKTSSMLHLEIYKHSEEGLNLSMPRSERNRIEEILGRSYNLVRNIKRTTASSWFEKLEENKKEKIEELEKTWLIEFQRSNKLVDPTNFLLDIMEGNPPSGLRKFREPLAENDNNYSTTGPSSRGPANVPR